MGRGMCVTAHAGDRAQPVGVNSLLLGCQPWRQVTLPAEPFHQGQVITLKSAFEKWGESVTLLGSAEALELRSQSPCLSQLPPRQVVALASSSPCLGLAWRTVFWGSLWMGFSSPCLRWPEDGAQVLFAYGLL